MSPIAPTLQLFFTERLVRQRQASPPTVVAYRTRFDCCCLRPEPHRQAALQLDWADLNVR